MSPPAVPPAPSGEVGAVTTAWADRWFDPAVGLLWNPPGSFTGVLADRSVHLLPTSAWYLVGLLDRDGPGDLDRARQVLASVLDHQYDRPGTPWHGTFARFAEWPEPPAGAREWDHYDPNWRQFVGTALLVVLRHHAEAIGAGLVARVEAALRLAVEGERPERVGPAYTNIALMKAVLEVEAGTRLGEDDWVTRGRALAAAVAARRFDEFNSPTYYGIDLLGLALWRTCPVDADLRRWGTDREQALWAELASHYHPGLGNLCGPYTRSYGMDMGRYVAAVALWMWPSLGAAAVPLPALDTPAVEHGHDLVLGPLVARLAAPLAAGALSDLQRTVDRPEQLEEPVGEAGDRVATFWLGPDAMLGGEAREPAWPAWHQYYPATAHWLGDRGGVVSARLVHAGPVAARAADGTLRIELWPAPDGSAPTVLLEGADWSRASVGGRHWRLDGRALTVDTSVTVAGTEPFGDLLLAVLEPVPGTGPAVLELAVHPTG